MQFSLETLAYYAHKVFTRYVYIPLGGNRKGTVRTYVNIMIVFLVSGIWHGTNWTFIVWGLLHGVAQVLTRLFDKTTGIYSKRNSKIINVISWVFTFVYLAPKTAAARGLNRTLAARRTAPPPLI